MSPGAPPSPIDSITTMLQRTAVRLPPASAQLLQFLLWLTASQPRPASAAHARSCRSRGCPCPQQLLIATGSWLVLRTCCCHCCRTTCYCGQQTGSHTAGALGLPQAAQPQAQRQPLLMQGQWQAQLPGGCQRLKSPAASLRRTAARVRPAPAAPVAAAAARQLGPGGINNCTKSCSWKCRQPSRADPQLELLAAAAAAVAKMPWSGALRCVLLPAHAPGRSACALPRCCCCCKDNAWLSITPHLCKGGATCWQARGRMGPHQRRSHSECVCRKPTGGTSCSLVGSKQISCKLQATAACLALGTCGGHDRLCAGGACWAAHAQPCCRVIGLMRLLVGVSGQVQVASSPSSCGWLDSLQDTRLPCSAQHCCLTQCLTPWLRKGEASLIGAT